jgi:hypothetical protein
MTAKPKADEKPIVQTVKLDAATFVRLKTYGAKSRRSNQDILLTALLEYLSKAKA